MGKGEGRFSLSCTAAVVRACSHPMLGGGADVSGLPNGEFDVPPET